MSYDGITRLPESHCLACGHGVNAAGMMQGGGPPPKPGDLAVCIRCGAVAIYGDDMRVRGLSEAEMDEIGNDGEALREIARVVKRVHLMRASLS